MKKKTFLFIILLSCAFSINAQIEEFRVAWVNSKKITANGKTVKVKKTITAKDTIRWPDSNAAIKLYGTTHKKIYLTGGIMAKLSAHTIENFISLVELRKQNNAEQHRNTTVRDPLDITLNNDTLLLFDTLYYTFPGELNEEGYFELHFHQGKVETILQTDIPATSKSITLPRDMIKFKEGTYEFSIWINNDIEDWNFPVIDGLNICILPEEL